MQKYQKGDRVKVLVGHQILGKGDNGWFTQDINPTLVDDTATVEYEYKEKYGGGSERNEYSLKFDKHGSISWFDEKIIIPA